MMHLNLIGHERWVNGHALSISAVTVGLSDAERHVSLNVPFHLYGQTRVAAIPVTALSGATVTLDLEHWELYDLVAERLIGMTFNTARPASPEYMAVAERYTREARRLPSTDLRAWVAQVIAQAGGRR
ncbi:hypothetical protein [Kutzneria kofuensis]|uniref:Uncharacterized protein n=1 Tax=Kutzneria kofuensis TaxID=103725 RepID=A0A7W9NHJ7_9PSEU|nr:hypothetical protein [Kutzneria kofuensis]MBB5892629.1 hypothetical protein [Kutzneria kofuensis]